ncbi:hypothetical protein [Chitinophaga sp. Cy-1792]|uniref:hypothetical protein n=1 Tax=Chitinophaga sp. Cy-1792 TaxID=2608339 RepID=UPI0014242F6E|nr:hypothetical protein [Chitinophaga sp. Cy-1792]NIG55445.1 hypothetical protein [Chitinophaga sp. Cy-1792]
MDWWVQVTIIAEYLEDAPAIAQYIHDQDAGKWKKKEYNRACYKTEETGQVLFYTYQLYYSYERQKCIPDWLIAELSAQNPQAYFTAMADIPLPGALLRYQAGKIQHHYLMEQRRTNLILPLDDFDKPNDLCNPDFLYHWFGHGKAEQQIAIDDQSLIISQELFDGIFPLEPEEWEILDNLIAEWNLGGLRSTWTEIKFE